MIGGDVPLNVNVALSKLLLFLSRAFTNCDECSICIAIITVEYQITNNVY